MNPMRPIALIAGVGFFAACLGAPMASVAQQTRADADGEAVNSGQWTKNSISRTEAL